MGSWSLRSVCAYLYSRIHERTIFVSFHKVALGEGTIVIDTPERPAGQQHALGLKAPKLNVVRVAFVGLGMRGPGAVERFTYIPGVQIVALCDYEKDRAEKCQDILRKASLPPAAIYSGAEGYKELCQREDVDLVYIAADWDHHFPIAKCALETASIRRSKYRLP